MLKRTAEFAKELFGDGRLEGGRDVGDGQVPLLLGRANDRGLESRKGEVVVVAGHGKRKLQRSRRAGWGKVADLGSGGIAQSEPPSHFVERLTGGVVDGFT